jgi:dTMP kinase
MPETRSRNRVSPPSRGPFFAFEGVEGSGKTTQVALLAEHLRARGVPVVTAREPGSTTLGERIRELVLEATELRVPPRSELFLMLAARAAFVEQVVRPALAEGKVVLADRFEISTLAYQGAGRGLSPEEIVRSNRFATGGLVPDATVLLQLDPEEGARRQAAAAKRKDRLEREGIDFHRRVARGYHDLAGAVGGLIRVDAAGSVEEVRSRIMRELSARFPETFLDAGFIKPGTQGSGTTSGLPGSQAVVEDE